jgi:hypothetical protein
VKRSLLVAVLLAGCGIDQLVDDSAKVVEDTADVVGAVVRDQQFWIIVGRITGAAGYTIVSAIVRGRDGAEYFVTAENDTRILWRRSAGESVALVEDPALSAFRVDDQVRWMSGGEEWTLMRGLPRRAQNAE